MELPKTKVPAKRRNPKLLTLFGQSKVGKTTMLSQLEDCLIIDTEDGTGLVDAMKVNANSLKEFSEIFKELKRLKSEEGFTYKYIAIDTIDNLNMWIERGICAREGVNELIDIAYGGGYAQARTTIMKWINRFKDVTDHLILIGHRKKALLGTEDSSSFSVASLDLSGKLKNIIMADSDAIGYIYREKDEESGESNLMVSFKTDEELEAGARQEHLRGKVMPFEWEKIFVD